MAKKMSATVETKKSCFHCPSFADSTDRRQAKYFGKAIGAPVCLRFGKVLGQPGANQSQERTLWEAVASRCDYHGTPAPSSPAESDFTVAFPVLPIHEASSSDTSNCLSCRSCQNLVEDDAFRDAFGWPTAFCRAKGKLIFQTRFNKEASNCPHRWYGTPTRRTEDIKLLPAFDAAFSTEVVNPIDTFFENKVTDPQDYETDKEVSEDDLAQGIRAWRRIPDPNGYGEPIFLPIFDIEKLPENLQTLVPRSGDDEHPELYVDHGGFVYWIAVLWMQLDETPALWGEPGNGKTELYRHLAWLMSLPFHRISITNSSELDDLAGKMHFTPGRGTYFEYGRVPKAWLAPGVICLDEPNTGPPDVWQFFRPLTDNSKQLVLDMNEGERIDRHPASFLGMAMNPAWDVRNVGASMIGDADGSRLMHRWMPPPPEKIERQIIKERVALDGWDMPERMMSFVIDVAKSIRSQIQEGTLPDVSWGVRHQIKVARALRWFGPHDAYNSALGDYLDPQKKQVVLDQVNSFAPDRHSVPWR